MENSSTLQSLHSVLSATIIKSRLHYKLRYEREVKLCQLFCWRVIPVSTEREQTLELNACVRTVAPKKVDENQDTSAVSSNYWWQFFLVARLIKGKADASSTVNQSVMWVVCMELSLLAEAPFPLYSLSWRTGRKGTSAMGRNSLWSNRRPWSWTAVSETHAPCIVCWPWREPTVSRAFLYSYSAVI